MKDYKIYYLTQKDKLEPKYIGATSLTLNKRLILHKSDANRTNHDVNKWVKSLKGNVTIHLIADGIKTKKEAFALEKHFINLYIENGWVLVNSLHTKAYSERLRKENRKPSLETLKKRSLALKGLVRTQADKEAKSKASTVKRMILRLQPDGILLVDVFESITEAVKAGYDSSSIRNSCKNKRKSLYKGTLWRYLNEPIEQPIPPMKKHVVTVPSAKRKKVYQYDKNGTFIREFPSTFATKEAGFQPAKVSAVCHGKHPHHKGFIWKYSDETKINI